MQKVSSKSDSWVATGDDLNDFLFMFVDKLFGIRDDVFEKVELLGKRTAEMHLALLSDKRKIKTSNQKNSILEYIEWVQPRILISCWKNALTC